MCCVVCAEGNKRSGSRAAATPAWPTTPTFRMPWETFTRKTACWWTTARIKSESGERGMGTPRLIAKEKRWVAPDRFSSQLNRRDSVYPRHSEHACR